MKARQQLFGIYGIDISQNGYEILVFSSWDGTTYLIDQKKNCLQFQFEDQVCGFIAGTISILYRSLGPEFIVFFASLGSNSLFRPILDKTRKERSLPRIRHFFWRNIYLLQIN